jgi:hypothetical protein
VADDERASEKCGEALDGACHAERGFAQVYSPLRTFGLDDISEHRCEIFAARLSNGVRELNPLPQVSDLIEPLRPEPAPPLATTRPSWERFASSFEPPVRDLLARERPGLALGEVHLEAMKLLVATLEKRKFAITDRPRKPAAQSADSSAQEPAREPRQSALTPRQRGRYVPAAERREVFERDGGRCTYVDSNGGRCCETRYLELHHLKPFAQGGANLASKLRCAAHNALAAEEDFGRELIEQRRGHARHESLAAQAGPPRDGAGPPKTPPDSA